MSKTKRWYRPRRCGCPRCSANAVTKRARVARLATEMRSHRARANENLAIKEQLEQPREQPLLDQLLGAAGLIRCNVTKEK